MITCLRSSRPSWSISTTWMTSLCQIKTKNSLDPMNSNSTTSSHLLIKRWSPKLKTLPGVKTVKSRSPVRRKTQVLETNRPSSTSMDSARAPRTFSLSYGSGSHQVNTDPFSSLNVNSKIEESTIGMSLSLTPRLCVIMTRSRRSRLMC